MYAGKTRTRSGASRRISCQGCKRLATAEQLAWLKTMVPAAQGGARRFSMPASVTLAQCILESGWGQSQLARRCRNYFGVKAMPGEPYREFTTTEVEHERSIRELASFAIYPSAIESFAAHARLIRNAPRYAPAMVAVPDIPKFCVALKQCGYSTLPDYAARLLALIAQHQLTHYDVPPPGQPAAAQEAA